MFNVYSYSDFITFRATPSPLSTMKKVSFELSGWSIKGTYQPTIGAQVRSAENPCWQLQLVLMASLFEIMKDRKTTLPIASFRDDA